MTEQMETNEPVEVLTADELHEATDHHADERDQAGDKHDDADQDSGDAGDDGVAERPDREAAKYRRRLREVEADRDATTTRLQQSQRSLVDHLASASGVRPAALWAAGTELSELLDEDGAVDPVKVQAACEHAASTLGLSRAPRPNPWQGGSGEHGPRVPSWQELIKQPPQR